MTLDEKVKASRALANARVDLKQFTLPNGTLSGQYWHALKAEEDRIFKFLTMLEAKTQ